MSGVRPRKILVIEDDEDSGSMLKLALELDGHQVRVARDGIRGLAAAADWHPEVVISDIGLPGKLDGYAVARELRFGRVCPAAFLVALTGRGLDEDKARARRAGFHAHVTKPVDIDLLESIVARGPPARAAATTR